MPLSLKDAKIVASLLTKQQHIAFRFLLGKDDTAKIFVTPEAIEQLVDYGLVKRDRTIEDTPRDVILVTPKGKQVARFV